MRIIRDARPEDAAALCQAEREVVQAHDGLLVSLPHELAPLAFQERIALVADGRGKYLVATNGDDLVGHACLYPMGLERVAHVLRLDMCIHLGHWRQGHGRALLGALIDWAQRQAAAHKIELLVRATNAPARALYQSFGFLEEGRHIDRIRLLDGQFVDDIAMALLLRKTGPSVDFAEG